MACSRAAIHVVASRADREVLEARGLQEGRCDGVAVVLEQEDERQAPGPGERSRLVEGTDREAAVTDDGDRSSPVPPQLRGQGAARPGRDPAGDDRACRDARRGISEVHGAAATAAEALGEAEDLSQRAPDRRDDGLGGLGCAPRVEADWRGVDDEPSQHVVVSTMGRGQSVHRLHRQGHPRGDRLLADAGVERPGNEPGVVEQPALEPPDGLDEEEGHRQRLRGHGGEIDVPGLDLADVRVVQGGSLATGHYDPRHLRHAHRLLAFGGGPPRPMTRRGPQVAPRPCAPRRSRVPLNALLVLW